MIFEVAFATTGHDMTSLLLATVLAANSTVKLAERRPIDFAYFGCNRVSNDVEKAQAAVNKSSANVAELLATFRDVSRVQPRFLFALGDLVNNYVADNGAHLRGQLDAWANLVNLDPAVTLVPVPGNHEMNKKTKEGKFANPVTDVVWTTWLEQNKFDRFAGNGPKVGQFEEDKLATDQSKLSYSFTVGTTRFILVNTDTRTTELMPGSTETQVGWVPTGWFRDQMEKAEADPNVRDVFVMGHKNLVDPADGEEDAPINRECGKRMIAAMDKSTKFRAYLCSHVHQFDMNGIPGTKAKQIVIGNGGSELNDSWQPSTGRWFGFAVIRVHEDGRIGLVLYRRPEPKEVPLPDALVPDSVEQPEIIVGQG